MFKLKFLSRQLTGTKIEQFWQVQFALYRRHDTNLKNLWDHFYFLGYRHSDVQYLFNGSGVDLQLEFNSSVENFCIKLPTARKKHLHLFHSLQCSALFANFSNAWVAKPSVNSKGHYIASVKNGGVLNWESFINHWTERKKIHLWHRSLCLCHSASLMTKYTNPLNSHHNSITLAKCQNIWDRGAKLERCWAYFSENLSILPPNTSSGKSRLRPTPPFHGLMVYPQ